MMTTNSDAGTEDDNPMEHMNGAISLPFQKPVAATHRWVLALIMLLTIAVGWRYPLVGFVVPAAMAASIAGSFFRGRYVCGNFCPRGSFFDTLFRLVGGPRDVPALLRGSAFRWAFLALLMGFLGWQISRNPADPAHWGFVFWMACALTTGIGIVLGLAFRARTWCLVCPVGTMANAIGGGRWQMTIAESCAGCGSCERHCPMGLTIAAHRQEGTLPHRDCLKCSSCVDACPQNALDWPS